MKSVISLSFGFLLWRMGIMPQHHRGAWCSIKGPPLLLFLLSKLAAQTARSLRHRQHPIQNIYLALAVCSALREKRPAASVFTPGNETLVRSEKYL